MVASEECQVVPKGMYKILRRFAHVVLCGAVPRGISCLASRSVSSGIPGDFHRAFQRVSGGLKGVTGRSRKNSRDLRGSGVCQKYRILGEFLKVPECFGRFK